MRSELLNAVDVDALARELFVKASSGWKVKAEWDELHWQTRELWQAHALRTLAAGVDGVGAVIACWRIVPDGSCSTPACYIKDWIPGIPNENSALEISAAEGHTMEFAYTHPTAQAGEDGTVSADVESYLHALDFLFRELSNTNYPLYRRFADFMPHNAEALAATDQKEVK